MKVIIMFGLDHVEEKQRKHEANRLLADLSSRIHTEVREVKGCESIILRDLQGNRVGIADIHA